MRENITRLREAASYLRTAEGDPGKRERAADVLDRMASSMEKVDTRLETWVRWGLLVALVALLSMVVAGIWVDWRWLATAAVPAAMAVVLGCMHYVMGEEARRGRSVR